METGLEQSATPVNEYDKEVIGELMKAIDMKELQNYNPKLYLQL